MTVALSPRYAGPIVGVAAKVAIVWALAIIAVVGGAILALRGKARHAAGGRRRYY